MSDLQKAVETQVKTAIEGSPMVVITLKRDFAVKLGKKFSTLNCQSIADVVKNKQSFEFINALRKAGIDLSRELEVADDVITFIQEFIDKD